MLSAKSSNIHGNIVKELISNKNDNHSLIVINNKEIDLFHAIHSMIDSLFRTVPTLLKDFSPIPEYMKKLVEELLFRIDSDVVKSITQQYVNKLPSNLNSIEK